jgi:hypothetical protein
VLEERRMLSTVTWINPNGADWNDASNWSTNQIPGPSDDVVIPALSSGDAVSITKKVANVINSLTAATPIDISSPFGLSIAGNYVPGGPINRGLLSDPSGITLDGGPLSDADVQAGCKVTTTAAGGDLQDVTLRSSLTFSLATVTVLDDLKLADGGQVTVGCSGQLDLVEATVDGTVDIVLGSGVASGLGGTIATWGHPVVIGQGSPSADPTGQSPTK